jgi:hypothetical protein
MNTFQKFTCLLCCLPILFPSCKEDVVPINQDHVIKIESESAITSLTADGKTIVSFKATIPANAVDEAKNVTFTITPGLGTFQGTVIDAKNTVPTDVNGIARTGLKLGSTAGTFYISASVTRAGTTYRSQDLAIVLGVPQSLKLEAAADNLQPEANGFTIVNITATTDDTNEKTLELTTNLGVFTQSTDPLKAQVSFLQGKATALIKISNQAVNHIITLTSGLGKTLLLQIHAKASRPELILVEPSASQIDTLGGSVELKAFLRKNTVGHKVSEGYPVLFRAYQLDGVNQKNVGRFTGTSTAVSDGDGNVTVVNFFADTGNIDAKKEIIIDCSAFKSDSEQIHTLTSLKVKK